jgi:hypothetical protein
MMFRTFLAVPLLITGALCAPLAATAAPTSATASPKALSLTLKDVQHVYGSTFQPFFSNVYKASKYHTCGADYTGSYAAIFGNFKKAGKGGGVVSVLNSIVAYPSSKSTTCAVANWATFLTTRMHSPSFEKSGATVHTSNLSGVGDTARLSTIAYPKTHAYSVTIWLARGTHSAILTVSSVGTPVAQSGAIALAKVLDGRIGAAG